MKNRKQVPRWLKHLDKVKAELREVSFPRSAEDGFRQCMALSAFALRLLEDGVRSVRGRADEKETAMAMSRLLTRMSYGEVRRVIKWRKDCVCFFQG